MNARMETRSSWDVILAQIGGLDGATTKGRDKVEGAASLGGAPHLSLRLCLVHEHRNMLSGESIDKEFG